MHSLVACSKLATVFIRETKTRSKKTGMTYTKYQVVESYRSEAGPRQRVLFTLTNLDLAKVKWKAFTTAIEERLAGRESLFDEDPDIARHLDALFAKYEVRDQVTRVREARAAGRDLVSVDLASATTTLSRSLGKELVANHFYESLGFGEILRSAGLRVKDLPLAKAVIIARLVHPGSDLATHRYLVGSSSLPELTDLGPIGKDRIYDIADRLYEAKDRIEPELVARASRLFGDESRLFLFDLTNTYLEGQAQGNDLAAYGHSKEKRYDCALVALALLVDDRGLPIFADIYEGNAPEPKALPKVLDRIKMGGHLPTIVMDRGIATKDNIALMRRRGLNYIVIERANRAPSYRDEFLSEEGFTEITTASGKVVRVKKLTGTDTTAVLVRSLGRAAKEEAIDTLANSRFQEELARLSASVSKGGVKRTQVIAERIGRIRARYPRASASYDIELLYHEDHGKVVRGRRVDRVIGMRVTERPAKMADKDLAGAYVIETTHAELDGPAIWGLYMTLTRVEDAFRTLKSDLGLRPIHHQLGRRTAAHLFVSVLAYHLLAAIEHTLATKGDTRGFSTIKEQLMTHTRSTMVLVSDRGEVYHLRVSGQPEPVHREIYRLLGVKDPLGRSKSIATHL